VSDDRKINSKIVWFWPILTNSDQSRRERKVEELVNLSSSTLH